MTRRDVVSLTMAAIFAAWSTQASAGFWAARRLHGDEVPPTETSFIQTSLEGASGTYVRLDQVDSQDTDTKVSVLPGRRHATVSCRQPSTAFQDATVGNAEVDLNVVAGRIYHLRNANQPRAADDSPRALVRCVVGSDCASPVATLTQSKGTCRVELVVTRKLLSSDVRWDACQKATTLEAAEEWCGAFNYESSAHDPRAPAARERLKVMQANASQMPDADARLVAAVTSGDVPEMERALQDGASTNLRVCRLVSDVSKTARYASASSPACQDAKVEDLTELLANRPMWSQTPELVALGAAGFKATLTGSEALKRVLDTPTAVSGREQNTMARVAFADAWTAAGVAYGADDLRAAAYRVRSAHRDDLEPVIAALAQSSGAGAAVAAAARAADVDTAAQAQRAADAKAAFEARQAAITQAHLTSLNRGDLVCSWIQGTITQTFGPLKGTAQAQAYLVSAFVEDKASPKVQLRVASIRMRDRFGRLQQFDQLDGEVVMRPGVVLWSDANRWNACPSE